MQTNHQKPQCRRHARYGNCGFQSADHKPIIVPKSRRDDRYFAWTYKCSVPTALYPFRLANNHGLNPMVIRSAAPNGAFGFEKWT